MRTSLKFCSTILALSAALAAMPATPALANGDRTDNTVTITDGVAGPYLDGKSLMGILWKIPILQHQISLDMAIMVLLQTKWVDCHSIKTFPKRI